MQKKICKVLFGSLFLQQNDDNRITTTMVVTMTRKQETTMTMATAARKWYGKRWIRDEKRLALYLRDGLRCVYCGATLEGGACLSLDHLLPRSKGGSNDATNLVTACKMCNSIRGDRPLAQWLRLVADLTGEDVEALRRRVQSLRRKSLDKYLAQAKALIAEHGNITKAMSI